MTTTARNVSALEGVEKALNEKLKIETAKLQNFAVYTENSSA